MDNTIWIKKGRELRQVSSSIKLIKDLPNKIYTIQQEPRSGELYLEEYADAFHFDFKIYGLETNLINHIMKTFTSTTNNLGILFNGTKGTGKTITAKILANKMQLPIILINEPFGGLTDFIADICCDCILFFDEYEKTFTKDENDKGILSIMDGVYNSPYRRVSLLTTNNLDVNINLIGRPSRIRYKKTFGNLQSEVVQEYLNDNLVNKEYTKEIYSFIDTLKYSTIDILKTIVDEVNTHDIPVKEFKDFFNVETQSYTYNIILKTQDLDDTEGKIYSIEDFKKDLSRLNKTEYDDKGNPYIVNHNDIDAYYKRMTLDSSFEALQIGELLQGKGFITNIIKEKGIIVTSTEYGYNYFIKILNLDSKPSIYKDNLLY